MSYLVHGSKPRRQLQETVAGDWTEIVRPGLEALPTVECPTVEDEEFRYVGDG